MIIADIKLLQVVRRYLTWDNGDGFERSQDSERPQCRQVSQIDSHRHVPIFLYTHSTFRVLVGIFCFFFLFRGVEGNWDFSMSSYTRDGRCRGHAEGEKHRHTRTEREKKKKRKKRERQKEKSYFLELSPPPN
jgi:hypothetical protein